VLTVDRWHDQAGGRTIVAPAARRASMPPRASAAVTGSWRGERDLQRYLQELQTRAGAIEQDLADLQRSLTYQLLFDGGQLTGVTRSRLEPAIGGVGNLWLGFAVLCDLLAEAASIVAAGSRTELDDLRNVEWLLYDDSVDLDGRQLTPDELLRELVHALSTTAQIIEEVDDVWRHTVPAMARCEEEVAALAGQASDLGAPQQVDGLGQLRVQVSWLRGQAAHDPLGVVEDFEGDVLPRLEQARLRLGEELDQQRAVGAELAEAQARLAELRELHARVVEEAGSLWAKIVTPRGLLAPPDSSYLSEPPMGLEPWLARLQALCDTGSHRPVRRGLASWMRAAEAARAGELEVLEANRGPIRQRQELRGLLSSFQAKAAALGVGRDAGLADIGSRARAILYAAQTDLDEATALVREYGDRLRVLNSEEMSYR
jgi:hypothetical protein